MHVNVPVIVCFVLIVSFAAFAAEGQPAPLVERLGFPPGTKVLIINGDDFGMNHSTNEGTFKAIQSGGITSATLMTPCPWMLEAAEWAKKHPQANIGVHTTLTSEWGRYKWGPVLGKTAVPSLCTPLGYFFDDVPLVYMSAKPEEVDKEVRAQVEAALATGLDITHIDSHMGTMQYAPGYHEMYLKIAKDYNLPCRMAGHDLMDKFGAGYLIEMADKMGVLHPDVLYMDGPPSLAETESFFKNLLASLQGGKVSELYIHCGRIDPEMKATTGSMERRAADTDFFSDPKTHEFIKSQNIELISYRELKHLQQKGTPMPRVQRYGWD